MATMEATRRQADARQPGKPAARRIRVSVRRVGPWSVLKFSLLFYLCLMLVVLLGLGILYGIVSSLGFLDSIAELLSGLGFGGGNFEFDGGAIFRALFMVGLLSVVIWSALTVFMVFLYNLISDLVGGIELTLLERR
ncbi:MAG: DUF3566 domain-containing protein [Actinomycetota bacterium]|nr:DUF3566 domain-containing protein [Actinomycetota bacterium]